MQRRAFVSKATTAPAECRFRVYSLPVLHLRLLVQIPAEDSPRSCSLTIVNWDTRQVVELGISPEDAATVLFVFQDILKQQRAPPPSPPPSPPKRGGQSRYLTQLRLPGTD